MRACFWNTDLSKPGWKNYTWTAKRRCFQHLWSVGSTQRLMRLVERFSFRPVSRLLPASCWRSLVPTSAVEAACHRRGTGRRLPRRSRTAPQIPLSHQDRDSPRRLNRVHSPHSTGPPQTIPRSWHISRSLSCPGLLDGSANRADLVVFRVISRFPGDRHWLGHLRMHEVSMTSLSTTIYEASVQQLFCQLPHFWRQDVLLDNLRLSTQMGCRIRIR